MVRSFLEGHVRLCKVMEYPVRVKDNLKGQANPHMSDQVN